MVKTTLNKSQKQNMTSLLQQKKIKMLINSKNIAPTIQMDAMKTNYKEATKELGEIVNEKEQADKWVKDWEQKLKADKKELGNKV
ncbi:ABC transporter substrate-binding protein [Staphylococcus roterodami]|nr:ABC transporter substrate-binding protein [Staphylococcus roterodami]